MKTRIVVLPIFLFFLNINLVASQEWKNLKSYQKETGQLTLQEGCWLKKNRKCQNEVWKKANLYNINLENGNLKYKTISEIRDFYAWFDMEREKQGHDIKWIGIASIAAIQFSKLDGSFIRIIIIRNKEVVKFTIEASKQVFEFGFPRLREVYFSKEIIKGKDAIDWDLDYGMKEQCLILDVLYRKLSSCAIRKLDRMAKGKGVFIFGVPKELKFEGRIQDCQTRFDHGIRKILPYYQKKQADKNRIR